MTAPLLACIAVVACAFTCWNPCLAGPPIVLTDLWDAPHRLDEIGQGMRMLLFICDPGLETCREGAVYFESRSASIRANRVKPICVFIGNPKDIREAVLALELRVPVFIDQEDQVFQLMLDQRVLPALALLEQDGTVVRTVYGGGESLDGNLKLLLHEKPKRSYLKYVIAIAAVIAGAAIVLVAN